MCPYRSTAGSRRRRCVRLHAPRTWHSTRSKMAPAEAADSVAPTGSEGTASPTTPLAGSPSAGCLQGPCINVDVESSAASSCDGWCKQLICTGMRLAAWLAGMVCQARGPAEYGCACAITLCDRYDACVPSWKPSAQASACMRVAHSTAPAARWHQRDRQPAWHPQVIKVLHRRPRCWQAPRQLVA